VKVVAAHEAPILKQSEVRAGATIRQVLLLGDTPEGLNFRLFRSQYLTGDKAFESPRHRHGFQQIRWTESGAVNYGPGLDIPEGDIAYFPRGTYYGPQRKDAGIGLLLQFGFHGEHQSGPTWDGLREEALVRLKARGELENGVFREVDPMTGRTRECDAAQALYEERYAMHTKRKFEIPPERYATPILMHTGSFTYYRCAPAVEVKHLGRFYDYPGPHADLQISVIRLTEGGVYRLGPERSQLGWAKSPGLQIGGRACPGMTCFYSPSTEELSLCAAQQVEIFLIEFPRLG